MAGPFKMKGNPMQRNFGIGGSPMQKITGWERVKANIKGLGKGIKTAWNTASGSSMSHSLDMGIRSGKKTRLQSLKKYDKD